MASVPSRERPHFDAACSSRGIHERRKRAPAPLPPAHGLNAKVYANGAGGTTGPTSPWVRRRRKSTVLTPAESHRGCVSAEILCCPWTMCLVCLKDAIPNRLSRSALHRCLQRMAISRLPSRGDTGAPQEVQELRDRFTSTSTVVNCVMPRASWSCSWPSTGSRSSPTSSSMIALAKWKAQPSSKPSWRSSPTRSTPCSPTTAWPSPTCPRIARAPAAASSARTSSTASAWQTP